MGEAPAGGRTFIAPRDPLGGGTWLAVNDAGICLALLNRYPADPAGAGPAESPPPGASPRTGEAPPPAPPTPPSRAAAPAPVAGPSAAGPRFSRGQLPWRLASLGDLDTMADALQALTAGEAPLPFQLLLLQGGRKRRALTWEWDGRQLLAADLAGGLPFLSSSAHRGAEVVSGRRALYAAAQADIAGPPDRWRFHRGHQPRRGAWSVCMHRPEARSVSYCQVLVTPRSAALRYAAGAPCRAALGPELSLELAP